MKTTWPVLLGLVILAAPTALRAQFNYAINGDGTATITQYTGSGRAVTIPTNINGLTVTGIGQYAFNEVTNLTSVTMADSITNFAEEAFWYCSHLTTVTISGSVTDFGNVVHDCTNLTNVIIANGSTSIADYAFEFYGLTGVTIPDSVTTIGEYAFYGTSLTSLTIPDSVTTIEDYAFKQCVSLTNVTISYGATTIGGVAFADCTSLTSISLPDSVTTIGGAAFGDCTSLNSVTIPDSVTNIEEAAFQYCTQLTAFTVGTNNPAYSTMNGVLFNENQTALVEFPGGRDGDYTIPGSVTAIGAGAFWGCSVLTNVSIPGSVTNIGGSAFEECTGLASVSLADSVTSIADFAFAGCMFTSINIPGSVTDIGESAFLQCTNLTSVYFQGNAPIAGYGAFADDYGPGGYDPATAYYFLGTTGWSSPFAGLSAVLIPYYFTTNAGALTLIDYVGSGGAVTIPATINGLPVTSLGTGLFEGLTNLASVTIPGSVTSIGNNAFSGSTNLVGVYFNGNAPTVGSTVFGSDSNAIVYYLAGGAGWGSTFAGLPTAPDYTSQTQFVYTTNAGAITITGYTGPGGAVAIPPTINGLPVTSIGDNNGDYYVFYDTFVTSASIGTNVANIGEDAFYGCPSLASITIPGSVTNIGAGAFDDCTQLTAITVATNNSFYSSVNGVLFDKIQATLVEYLGGLSGSYTIPNSVTSIGDGAFADCIGLSGISIPGSVTSIGSGAFTFCTGLTSLTIPGSVTAIGNQAFSACFSLTNVYFEGNAPVDGGDIFQYDPVTTIYYVHGTIGWGATFSGVNTACEQCGSGSLQVTITPAGAVTAGAQWYVDGGTPQPSGATVSGLSVGDHTVSFTTINGWTTPASQNISISVNSAKTATGFYTRSFTPLYSFTASDPGTGTNSDGANPIAGLLLLGNTLYGTAADGGSAGTGSIFAMNTEGSGFTNLYSFTNGADGAFPQAGLMLSGATLYGTAVNGGSEGVGTIFAISTNGAGFTNLYGFTNGADGGYPQAGLLLLGATLYGTAVGGGSEGEGSVFAINTNGTGFTNLYSFTNGADGATPSSGLLLLGATLYGTAANGGSEGVGTIFAISTNGSGFTNLYSFTNGADGATPQAGLLLLGATLYGTAANGGSASVGTVFAINTNGTGFTNLYSFTNGADGANPLAGLILLGETLYGTAVNGGPEGYGSVFAINTNGTGFTNLYSFTNGADGAYPQAGLLLSGNTLYGTASAGGIAGNGTVFALVLPVLPSPPPPSGIIGISLSGPNLVLDVTNGQSGGIYYVLMSTNLALPLSQWTRVGTNVLSAAGNFTITATNTVTRTVPQRFYLLQTQ